MNKNKFTIIDVRTPGQFIGGNVAKVSTFLYPKFNNGWKRLNRYNSRLSFAVPAATEADKPFHFLKAAVLNVKTAEVGSM